MRRPQLIAEDGVPSYRLDTEFCEWLKEHYELVRSFPQGPVDVMDLWVSKSAKDCLLTPLQEGNPRAPGEGRPARPAPQAS